MQALQQHLSYNNNLPSLNAHQEHHHDQQQQEWSQCKLSPVSAHPHPQQQMQMPLTSQLDYYRQLQIMHCQRERDIEQLYRQHQIFQQHPQVQQQQQQDRPPSHAIQRGLLAQRMLQLQRLFQAQQIQKMQAMHKRGRAAVPTSSAPALSPSSTPSSSPSPSPSSSFPSNGPLGIAASEPGFVQMSSEFELSRAETGLTQQQPEENRMTKNHDPNTIHLPSTTSRPSPTVKKTTSVPELAQIVLPSLDQIRKQRQQRLKFQARLRQAASAAAAKTMAVSSPKATPKGTTADGVQGQSIILMPASPPASPSPYSTLTPDFSTPTPQQQYSPSFAITTTNTMTPMEEFQKSNTRSTTSLVARSKADLAYRRQLRLQHAIQQHLIQDHTHRYRLFQAFCLLQRAQAAQAMDEVQTQRQRQLQTVAWVQALRQSQSLSQLEIPQ
ncbi:hypothetical protein EC957_009852 [Mortierella hygrophila]|uniref:Uncharacterized protein n=1 Tax=Mortierella hygrophila TaxID=979708 RepID=A0A9P6K4X5_9FUNG|nr:hypothetical protein EC957_009852 [Mortierella hygrophila]